MNESSPSHTKNRNWLLGLFLVAAIVLAYQQAWHAGFIWDDNDYVTENPLLTAPDGLHRIWFSLDSPSQYFPMVYSTFRLEHALWGLNPAGYHGVNILLHALNALLVWRLLSVLAIPGAWLAAAIFALHPVNVESVAWVTQLKNTESLFFFLLTLLAWVQFLEEPTRRRWYALALLIYPFALFSKTTACTLPAALVLILWLKQKPITLGRIAQVIPFLAFGVCMGVVSMWWEHNHQGTEGSVYAISFVDRVLIATRAIWFYLGKLLWPANLTFNYPLWKIDAGNPLAYVGVVAALGFSAAIFYARRSAGRAPETAAVFFVAMLSPLLGFIMLYTFRYTFVADHYQYVATLGPITLAAAALSTWGWLSRQSAWLKPTLCGALLATLGVLTWKQCAMYADLETLWQTTVARNPESFMGHNNLGAIRLQQNRLEEAEAHFRKAVEIEPASFNAHYNLGHLALHRGDLVEAAARFKKVLELQPADARTHADLAAVFLQQGQLESAATQAQAAIQLQPNLVEAHYRLAVALFQIGHVDDAIPHFRKVAELQPENAEVRNNLGWALLQSGRTPDAIAQFEALLKLQPDSAPAHANLALALQRSGQRREAIAHYGAFLKLQPDVPPALSSLAWLLATSSDSALRDGARAIEFAQRANQLSGGRDPRALQSLAAAYAEVGRFADATAVARNAIELVDASNNAALHDALRSQLKSYQAGAPFRELDSPNATAASTAPNALKL